MPARSSMATSEATRVDLYDFAAGRLIAAEAGATITDFAGNVAGADTDDVFIASNGTDIHDYLVREVARPLSSVD